MSEQFFSTTRLGNVMKLIALGHQTGLLQVMRGNGNAREEGLIQFENGEITMATIGQLRGQAALAVLQNWGEAFYQFLDGVVQAQSARPSNRLSWNGAPNQQVQPPSGSGSYPSGMGMTGPQPGMNGSSPQYNPYATNPALGGSQPGMGNPGTSYPPGPQGGSAGGTSYGSQGGSPLGNPATRVALLDSNYIARRLLYNENGASLALERRERQLLLLVDGRRTITDLVRLTRRSEDEVQSILAHLIAMNLVK